MSVQVRVNIKLFSYREDLACRELENSLVNIALFGNIKDSKRSIPVVINT
jgi:hypothetical protein